MAFCPNCGNQIKEGAKFCSYCGGQISSLIDSSDENNVLSQVENVNSVESDNHEKAESMPAIQNYVYDDDDMTGLRSKINTNNKKTKHKDKLPSSEKKTKKIIILILCLSLIASGGVAAYLLLSDNAKDDSSSLRTIDNNSIVSSQHENSSLSSDDSSEVKTIEKWETKDLSEPNADLKTTEMMIDRFKRDKYTTGIKVDYDSLSSFLSSRFKSNNAEAKLVDSRNEDIYTRLSDDIDFYGIVGSSEVSVVNGKTDDVIADGSFKLTSAVFDGANELTLHMNYEGTIDEIQQQSKKDLATFVDENMAEYMKTASLFVTKPGGLSSTEAAVSKVPILHTAAIPGCETRNAEFFSKNGMSKLCKASKKELSKAIEIIDDEKVCLAMAENQRKRINSNAAADICDLAEKLIKC